MNSEPVLCVPPTQLEVESRNPNAKPKQAINRANCHSNSSGSLVAFHVQNLAAQSDKRGSADVTEELVHVQTKDDIAYSGALFAPPKKIAKPIAVIWIHGGESISTFRRMLKLQEH